MQYALKNNNHGLVKWLLANRNFELNDILYEIIRYGDIELIKKSMRLSIMSVGLIRSEEPCTGRDFIFRDDINRDHDFGELMENAAKKGNLDEVKFYIRKYKYDKITQREAFKLAIKHGHFLVARYLFAIFPIDILYKHKAYRKLSKMTGCDNDTKIQMADWICSFDKRYDYQIINSQFEFAPVTD